MQLNLEAGLAVAVVPEANFKFPAQNFELWLEKWTLYFSKKLF